RLVDAAGDAQAVVFLIAAHGIFDVVGEAEAVALGAGQLAAHRQPLAQQRHALVVVLGPHHAVAGYELPAAGGDDILIAGDRALERTDHGLAAERRAVGAQVVEHLRLAWFLARGAVGRQALAEARNGLPLLAVLGVRTGNRCSQ